MLDTTDRTPAQMAARLLDDMLFHVDAEAYAHSHQDEAQERGKPDLADYWSKVADLLATASER